MDTQTRLRALPKVDDVLASPRLAEELSRHPRTLVVEAVRESIDSARVRILAERDQAADVEAIVDGAILRVAEKVRPSLRRVINATGVVLHTNLGRAVLSRAAADAVVDIARGYSTLEYDATTGARGSRHVHIEELICRLTGAEAAMAVNNNAAAVLLGISGLARGGEVIVSRGQLVEIGGSFRIPDIMAESGATMVEVGTTNKTHLRDYENALSKDTRLILRVHSSNYRVIGFAEEANTEELVRLGAEHGIPVFEDQGSGVLVDLRRFGLPYEPTVGESLAAGVSLVSCSGDKLLGGAQAGIIAGRSEIIGVLKKHPLARALRLDKMTLAALEATLRAYLDQERAFQEIPTLRMLTITAEEVRKIAEGLSARIGEMCGEAVQVEVIDTVARAGGGALPTAEIPSSAVAIVAPQIGVMELERRLRLGPCCVVARISEDRLLLDPRTLLEGEDVLVAEAVARAIGAEE
ncbi:MAG: L-seryl-tRNA(Sec) selenium transferase [Actinobacteria bacterium]|nr:L-seryl-tRNA(Sec) selenium transferase [Actinomycetota bacterium]